MMADISAKQASRRLLRLMMEALAAWAVASSARARWLSFCQVRTACLILRAFSGVMGTSSPADELIGVGAAEAEGLSSAEPVSQVQALLVAGCGRRNGVLGHADPPENRLDPSGSSKWFC